MFEAEDEWINAICALIARSRPDRELAKRLKKNEPPPPGFSENRMIPDPDPKPLAALLRGKRPIPDGVRDTLAELLDPGDPEYLGCKLKLIDTGKTTKNLIKLEAVCGRRHTH
jgi:hypothetical protein